MNGEYRLGKVNKNVLLCPNGHVLLYKTRNITSDELQRIANYLNSGCIILECKSCKEKEYD